MKNKCPVPLRKFKKTPIRSSNMALKGVYWVGWTEDLTTVERAWLTENASIDQDSWVFYLTPEEFQKISC